MNRRRGKAKRIAGNLAVSIGLAAMAIALLADAGAVGDGIRRGLSVCGGVLIPSLFPFMVLSGFLSATDYGRILSLPLGGFVKKVFRLPPEMGSTVLLSMIGGFPVGARMLSGLLEQGRIKKETAERMLGFCVNAGPSFLITAVGAGMFLDKRAGLILFGTQITASVLVGALTARLGAAREAGREDDFRKSKGDMAGATAFVNSVTGAAAAMINLCAFAVLFSGLLEMAAQSGVTGKVSGMLGADPSLADAILAGLLEVTSGCAAAARIGGSAGFALASLFLSFSGISVIFQVLSFFRDQPIRVWPFLRARLLHMALSTAMAIPLYNAFCASRTVWVSTAPPRMLTDNRTILTSLCLLGMCTALVAAAGSKKKG